MATRYNINDFALANPAYVGATVSFWTVSGGVKTATLATLYAAATGSTTLTNPRALDSDGKFSVPVYVEVATVATVSGLTVADHDTGIMGLTEAAASASAAAAAASETAAAASAAAALVSENNVASAAFGTVSETFNGGGSAFVIAYDAGTLSNIEVFISGVHQVPTTDFTYNNATRTVTTTSTTPSGTGNVLVQYARLRTSAFFTPGIIDNATAKALTLSGSGANSVTIANSATNPTIGTSTGALSFNPVGQGEALRVTTGGASTVNYLSVSGGVAGTAVTILSTGADANVNASYQVKGSGTHFFLGANTVQAAITPTASADRYITLTGSNGGNPTIGTSAGSLNLSAAVICASTLSVGTDVFAAGYAQINSDDATPAGGLSTVGYRMGSAAVGVFFGSGAPTLSAPQGSIYLRTDGGASTRLYSNNNGTTGWSAITSA